MKELQEHLIRASAVARLDQIIGDLSAGGAPTDDENRSWLADLLHPLNDPEPGPCRLTPSPNVTNVEGSAILSVLMEQVAGAPDALSKLEQQVRDLARLRSALLTQGTLGEPLRDKALDVVKRLRGHFIGVLTPVGPDVDGLV
jgi:hypothetical protein